MKSDPVKYTNLSNAIESSYSITRKKTLSTTDSNPWLFLLQIFTLSAVVTFGISDGFDIISALLASFFVPTFFPDFSILITNNKPTVKRIWVTLAATLILILCVLIYAQFSNYIDKLVSELNTNVRFLPLVIHIIMVFFYVPIITAGAILINFAKDNILN